jgi:hypothetical protein
MGLGGSGSASPIQGAIRLLNPANQEPEERETRKSSFQGSLYLSRESLGNHFFEEFQKSSRGH